MTIWLIVLAVVVEIVGALSLLRVLARETISEFEKKGKPVPRSEVILLLTLGLAIGIIGGTIRVAYLLLHRPGVATGRWLTDDSKDYTGLVLKLGGTPEQKQARRQRELEALRQRTAQLERELGVGDKPQPRPPRFSDVHIKD